MRADMVLHQLIVALGSVGTWIVALGGVGTWLLLPHRHGAAKLRVARLVGATLTGLAAFLLLGSWTPPGPILTNLFFYLFALVAVAGGVLMITARSPVMSALWFAAVVLATSGLFLLAGAPFLAAGTVIVYAGAIIVTFLFVIMLAQSGGEAAYDRSARMPGRATLSCFLLLWALLYCLQVTRHPVLTPETPVGAADGQRTVADTALVPTRALAAGSDRARGDRIAAVLEQAVRPTALLPCKVEPLPGETEPNVAGLGGTLYTDHLISVEVAGAILFVALVGAAAIATPRPPVRPRMEASS